MKLLATLAAGMAVAAATLGVAAAAHAGGPPGGDGAPSQCSDDDLAVTTGQVGRLTHCVAWSCPSGTRRQTRAGSSDTPKPDLVTAAGGVLVHVERRPALAAHVLTLAPGDVANADVESYAIDTATGNSCQREGTLVVTPPNGSVSHTLNASLPICSATISSVD